MKKIYDWLKAKLNIRAAMSYKRCEKCNSTKIKEGYYIRGYNDLCNQANGDDGYYCYNCHHVTFYQSLESYKKSLPEWCKAYGI